MYDDANKSRTANYRSILQYIENVGPSAGLACSFLFIKYRPYNCARNRFLSTT